MISGSDKGTSVVIRAFVRPLFPPVMFFFPLVFLTYGFSLVYFHLILIYIFGLKKKNRKVGGILGYE